MSARRRPSRRRNRPWRAGGWDPVRHNQTVRARKSMRKFIASVGAARRAIARFSAAMNALGDAASHAGVVFNDVDRRP